MSVEIWREPWRGGFADPRMFLLPGDLRNLAAERGRWPAAPLARLTGMEFAGYDEHETSWKQPVTGWLLSSQGLVPGGLLGVVADFALGSVVGPALPPRTLFSTSEMSFNFLRAATLESREITAVGRLIGVDGRLALSECDLLDADGRELALVTCRNVIGDQLPETEPGPDPGDQAAVDAFIESLAIPPADEHELPDPYLRPPAGEVLGADAWKAGGLAVLRGQLAGEVPHPPIHHLLGVRPTAAEVGEVRFAMPASGWLASGFGSVEGGFLAFLAYSALASAVQTTTAPGVTHVPVDLKINFLRPVYPDPGLGDLTAVGRVVHRGRTLSVADAEVFGVDGRKVAIGRGTSMFLAGDGGAG
ncbi:MAG: hypothetical protein QOE92_406 [Chloroflexota bacterium]|jgi:uncharacterized protein (TIGR00369 family)|nr:hypothetical protein [Chloroflexota bacterium]